uniref:hypothetical protein n=1 Tax=Paractinoplanes polyasparticus TaxID=2856853 RepID=UPI001C850849|nr:hypothetical protein [Actinoplanes polyasparticus]
MVKRSLLALVSLSALLTGGAAAPAAPPGFDPAATAARLDALHIRIAGNAEEHRAAERLNYHRVEISVERCMRAHRRPYRKPLFVSFYRDFVDADFGVGNGSASITDSLTAGTRRWELNAIAGARLTRAGAGERVVRPEDAETLNKCTAPFEHRMYTDFEPPSGVYDLSGFGEMQSAVHRDAAVLKAWGGYNACMKTRHGYVVGPDYSDFLFAPHVELRNPPLDGAPAGPGWHRAVARFRALFAADVDCRRPAHTAAMRVVARLLPAWESRHRGELRAVRKAWRQRVTAAAKIPA